MIKNIGIEEQVRLWDGLLSYYALNSTGGTTAYDAIGGNNGICTSIDWNASGKNGYCASFNATSDKIDLGYNLNFERTQPWSISMWVKRSQVTSSTYMLFSKSVSYTNGYAIYFTQYNDYLEINVAGSATKRFYLTTVNKFTGTTEWYHIVWTYAGTSTYQGNHIYINAVDEAVNGTNAGTFDVTILNAAPCLIGNRNTDALGYNGLIDEVAIWNRVLNEAEVKALYSNGNGKFYGTQALLQDINQIAGLQSYWRLNEVSGSTASDSKGGLTGTLINGAFDSGGKRGYCWKSTSGTGRGIECGDIYNFERTDSFTLSCWVKSTVNSTLQHVLYKQTCAPPYPGWCIQLTTNKLAFQILNANVTNSINIVTEDSITYNVWSHVVVSYNGTSKASGCTIYLNGRKLSFTVNYDNLSLSTQSTSATPFAIGGRCYNNFAFIGYIDEVAVYNRVLSPLEIKSIYNAGNGLYY